MKKVFISVVVILMVFSVAFIGISCKTTATTTAAETTAAATTAAATTAAAETTAAQKVYKIGFSNASTSNPWRVTFVDTINFEAARIGSDKLQLIMTDANEDPTKQMADCEDLLTQDIDALLISPAVSDALAPVVGKAHEKGIPIVVVDRAIGNPDFDAFVYTDCRVIGKALGDYLVQAFNGKADIVYLAGITGAGPEIERGEGLAQAFKDYPDMKIIAQQDANWNEADGLTVMENILQAQKHIDVVLCSDGNISIGALKAIKAAGREDEIKVAAMDAHRTDSLINLRDGVIMPFTSLNVIYVGGYALKVTYDILQGKKPTAADRIVQAYAITVDKSNVDKFIDPALGPTDYSWKAIYEAALARDYNNEMK